MFMKIVIKRLPKLNVSIFKISKEKRSKDRSNDSCYNSNWLIKWTRDNGVNRFLQIAMKRQKAAKIFDAKSSANRTHERIEEEQKPRGEERKKDELLSHTEKKNIVFFIGSC